MHDKVGHNGILFDASNVVVPRGWKVISHGTSFRKWDAPVPGYSSQNLKQCSEVFVGDTVDGGLACVGDKEGHMPEVYAGSSEPVVFRVLVPYDFSRLDARTATETLRFLKPDNMPANNHLIPKDTVLVKVSENITDRAGAPSVIWYVPKQFMSLFEHDLNRLNLEREQSAPEATIPGMVLDDAFSAYAPEEEEHIIEQEEKADEYFEDLEAQQQELIDAELEAEAEKEAKRVRDKEKARAQDKKNFARAEEEHARQVAETNEMRNRAELSSEGHVPSEYSEPYEYQNPNNGSPYDYTAPAGSEPETANYEQPIDSSYSSAEQSEDSSYFAAPGSGEQPSAQTSSESAAPYEYSNQEQGSNQNVPYEQKNSVDIDNGHSSYKQGSDIPTYEGYESKPSDEQGNNGFDTGAKAPNGSYDQSDYQEPSEPYSQEGSGTFGTPGVSASDVRNRQLMDDDYAAEEMRRQEASKAFQEDLQAEALRRQENSENYKSFGSSGIDFSGHDDHSAYYEKGQGGGSYSSPSYGATVAATATGVVGETAAKTITTEEIHKYEQAFMVAREKFRSYEGEVPKDVARDYKAASDKYFSVQRGLAEGSLIEQVLDNRRNRSERSADAWRHKEEYKPSESYRSSKHDEVISPASSSPMPAGQEGTKGFGGSPGGPRKTAQNTQTGDSRDPRSSASLKDPPKSPFDDRPLTFSKERFAAIRRFCHHAYTASGQSGQLLMRQVSTAAMSDETGTARQMTSTTRKLSNAIDTLDLLAGGTGKTEASKIWSQRIAADTGTKCKGINKTAIDSFGEINIKNIDEKLKARVSVSDMAQMRKKFGDAADLSIKDAVGRAKGSFIGEKVNVRAAEGKIGALRDQATNLKEQLKPLKEKRRKLREQGLDLTGAELQQYNYLMGKKKGLDDQLRKTVGATNVRHKSEGLYRQINSMSFKKLNKELNKLEEAIKKGKKLNPTQMRQLALMRDRKALLEMRSALSGGGKWAKAKHIGGIGGRTVGNLLRKSQDETMSTMASVAGASRYLTNRHIRTAIKWSLKMSLKPAKMAAKGAAWVSKKTGLTAVVKKQTQKATNAAASQLLHTKPGATIHSMANRTSRLKKAVKENGGLRKSVSKGIRTGVGKLMPNKAKAAAAKIREVFNRLNNNRFVRFGKGVLKAPFKAFSGLSKGLAFIKKAAIKYVIVPAAGFFFGAFIITAVVSTICSIPASVFCGEEKDDKVDLSHYVEVINDEQKDLNKIVTNHKNNTEARGGKYKKVYVNYYGGANNNNTREILSMTAVYFSQDFSNENLVDEYIAGLFNASNYVTTSESEMYHCSGCETRDYYCYEKTDKYATDARIKLNKTSDHSGEKNVGEKADAKKGCKKSAYYSCKEKGHGTYNADGCTFHNNGKGTDAPAEGCDEYSMEVDTITAEEVTYKYYCLGHCHGKHYDYSCPGHTEKICKGHIDLYVDVVCMGFDQIYSVDPGSSGLADLGDYKQGELLDTFKITYYCVEKYAHICNDAAPGKQDDGKTASGTIATPGRTIAVDPSVIPYGTPVVINGHVYVAEDAGGAIDGKRIDIAVATHQEALSKGTDVFKVYKAELKTADDENDGVVRKTVDYLEIAKRVGAGSDKENGYFNTNSVLKCFGESKSPKVAWTEGYKDKELMFPKETPDSYTKKLSDYDAKHKNEEFTNVEANTLKYVEMSMSELRKLAKERTGKDYSKENSAYSIIVDVLIPYDEEHPDVFVGVEKDEDPFEGLYFEGWNKDNREWCETIYENMSGEDADDIYIGLDDISSGSGGGTISLDDVIIQGSSVKVKYYSQHDKKWASTPVRSDYPKYTISSSGCGFTSMAIVTSSLTSKTKTPVDIANEYGKTYYAPGSGAYWSLIPKVSSDYGLSCQELSYNNVQTVIDSLKNNKLVVVLVGKGGAGYTGDGYYTGGGHFLVICGVTKDGKFLLADPNNASVSTSGKGVDMQHFLDSGVKSWWVIGK